MRYARQCARLPWRRVQPNTRYWLQHQRRRARRTIGQKGSFFAFQNEKNKTDGDQRHRNEERGQLEAAHAALLAARGVSTVKPALRRISRRADTLRSLAARRKARAVFMVAA